MFGFGKFGIEDQDDLAGAERGDDLKIVGGDLQACDVKCWEVGRNNWYTVFTILILYFRLNSISISLIR